MVAASLPPRRLKPPPARNLLERPRLGQGQVRAFLDDLTIPFDNSQTNNQAERDLRLLKTQQKIAGCCRSDAGAQAFACLRSSLSSLRKHGAALLDALRKHGAALLDALHTFFTGSPLYPAWG